MERDSIGISLELNRFHVCRYMLAGAGDEGKVEGRLPTRIHDTSLRQMSW